MSVFIKSGYFLVALAALGFSVKSVLVKVAYGHGVEPMTLMLMRIFIAMPFFVLTFIIFEGRGAFTSVSKREIVYSFFMGVIGLGLAILFFFYSVELIDASLTTLVIFTYPVLTVLVLVVFFGEKLSQGKVLALVMTFIGLTFVIKVGDFNFIKVNSMGIVYGLIASCCYAFYNIVSESALKGAKPIRLITFAMSFAVVFFGLLFGWRTYPTEPVIWLIAAILGVVSTYLPFLLYLYGVKRIGAAKSVLVSTLGPIFTVIWAYIFIGERLDTYQLFGMALIVTGITAMKVDEPFKKFSSIFIGSQATGEKD